jgi:Flp pilus assembly protein TadG
MNAPIRNPAVRLQGGSAAVEFALILPVIVAMLAFSLFFGRVCWHYSAAVKAAHDAARYLSTVPVAEMRTLANATNAALVARAIAQEEIAELKPGGDPPVITILCDTYTCDGLSTPTSINVTVRMGIFDNLLYGFTYEVLGDQPLVLTAASSMRYVGK